MRDHEPNLRESSSLIARPTPRRASRTTPRPPKRPVLPRRRWPLPPAPADRSPRSSLSFSRPRRPSREAKVGKSACVDLVLWFLKPEVPGIPALRATDPYFALGQGLGSVSGLLNDPAERTTRSGRQLAYPNRLATSSRRILAFTRLREGTESCSSCAGRTCSRDHRTVRASARQRRRRGFRTGGRT